MYLIEDIAKVIDESCALAATQPNYEAAYDKLHDILSPTTCWTTTVGTTVPPDEQ